MLTKTCMLIPPSFVVLALLTFSRRYKSWRTTILLPWAAALMVSGYVIREIGAFHTDNLTFLIASTVLIMSGP